PASPTPAPARRPAPAGRAGRPLRPSTSDDSPGPAHTSAVLPSTRSRPSRAVRHITVPEVGWRLPAFSSPTMTLSTDYRALLETASAEARQGLAEGGIPIGAALYHRDGRLLGCGHNRRVQEGDPSV